MTRLDAPVGIVGAGPVGLALALRLSGLGVASVVLEAESQLVKRGSKACCIQGDVIEVLDKVGCAGSIVAEGVEWRVAHLYIRGREIETTRYPRAHGFPPFVNISQYRTEQLLLHRLEERSLAEVRWDQRAVGIAQDDGGVTATCASGRRHRFRYLVACDGVRSELRLLAGASWTGYTHGDRFLITDIYAALPIPPERHFHYDPPFNPGRQVIMHAQPAGMWRIDWQLPADADIEAERADGRLERRIRAVIGDVDYEIDWLSTYRFHQRVVDRFRVGNVFFAGDAAHALPPYGARGMNSGIQDADNLAWKLAAVIDGRAGDGLLDSYHDERHAAARENLAITEATIRFMVPATRRERLARAALLRLAPGVRGLRRRVNAGRMAEPFTYSASPIVEPAEPGSLVGKFAPDGLVVSPGGTRRLRQLLGQGFVVLLAGENPALTGQLADEILAHELPVRVLTLLPAGADASAILCESGVLQDASGLLPSYAPDGTPRWYLIRPDGHIAASHPAAELPRLATVFGQCSGWRAAPDPVRPTAASPDRAPAAASKGAGEGARP